MEEFGRYQLLKVLARGGMGEVHLARQAGMQGFEKLVVVKRILPHLAADEEFVHMFMDEARIAARLNHANVVQIFDLGQEGDYLYMAMEYVHGEDVRRVVRKAAEQGRTLPPALACRIIADAAAGLDYAHRKADERGVPLGIVHRDIAPHNLLVTFDGAVKVIDFGIARATGRATHTATGAIKGRFEYMSPEHAAGLEVDHRSDIFALGVVLWELLAGERLFKRDNEMQTLLAVSECRVAPPSTKNPVVPPELDTVVLKALARLREDRYADAQTLRLALEDWIVHARQPASAAHLAAFMRDVYADRLEQEARLGHPALDELGPMTGSASSRPGSEAGATRDGTIGRPRGNEVVATDGERTRTASNPGSSPTPTISQTAPNAEALPPAKRPRRWVIPAGLGALAVSGGLVTFALRSTPPSPSAPMLPTPVAEVATTRAEPLRPVRPTDTEPAATTAATPPPAQDVTVELHSVPSNAEIVRDGRLLGHTTLVTSLPRGDRPVRLELRMKGYRTQTVELVPLENQSLSVVLQKVEAPRPPPTEPKPKFDIKLGR